MKNEQISNRFQNQIAVITGGADGLGKALARRYLLEGAKVILFDINRENLEKTQNEFRGESLEVDFQVVDVSDTQSVQDAFAYVSEKYSKLDIMVNSAGIVGPTNIKITDVPDEGFDKVSAVNLRGSFLTAKYALRLMEENNYGRVLLVASIAGKDGNAGMSCYSSTKSGVVGLVKSIGKEFAESNITVNGLAPAVIRTKLVDDMPPEQVKYMTDKIPMKRCGTMEEFVAIASWITSKEASFNTGTVFDLSGGRAVY
jgi:3-oxoacyl-[acyl-carrier protein] reductase